MKRSVLFIQGGGAGVHDDWDRHLVESLSAALGPNYEIHYPRMPDEDKPTYRAWKAAIEREIAALDDGVILVGHSLGGTVLASVLAEQTPSRAPAAIFLISPPFVGEGGWPPDQILLPKDLGARLPPGVPIYLYYGLSDETVPPSHVDLYARAVPQARIERLAGRDHQLNNDLREVAAAIQSLEDASASKAG
jgi:predicted alpha/beta hydrolase family esterase